MSTLALARALELARKVLVRSANACFKRSILRIEMPRARPRAQCLSEMRCHERDNSAKKQRSSSAVVGTCESM